MNLAKKTVKAQTDLGNGFARLDWTDGTSTVALIVPLSMTVKGSAKAEAKEEEDDDDDDDDEEDEADDDEADDDEEEAEDDDDDEEADDDDEKDDDDDEADDDEEEEAEEEVDLEKMAKWKAKDLFKWIKENLDKKAAKKAEDIKDNVKSMIKLIEKTLS